MSWKHKLFMCSLFLHSAFAKVMGREIRIVNKATPRLNLSNEEPRVATLELMSREIYHYGIEGNTAELGVYRGYFAKAINHFLPDRKLYLFDTFEGFDARDTDIDKERKFSDGAEDFSETSEELVLSKMEHPENCIIRKGWFPETANGVEDKFCFVSIDADLYQPILAGLEFFYPRLSHGGAIMIHDFNNPDYKGAREAVKEFCDKNNTGYVCLSDVCGSAVIVR